MTYGGNLVWACFGHSTTIGGGDASADKHIPINPVKSLTTPNMKDTQTYEYFPNSYVPQIALDDLISTNEITITTFYRDPFLLLTGFPYKTVTGSWTGTGDDITANFSALDNKDYIWLMVYLRDQAASSHLQYIFDGGEITNYKWTGEPGKYISEEVTIKFSEEAASDANAVDIDDGFDDDSFTDATAGFDGGWSLWDGTYSTHSAAAVQDTSVTWGGSAIGDIDITKWTVELVLNRDGDTSTSSRTQNVRWLGTHEYKATIEGVLSSNTNIGEVLSTYNSKSKQTFKISIDNQYIQFTNAVLDNREPFLELPEAGDVYKPTLTFKGGVGTTLTYNWNGDEADDPSALINHSSP